jgi:2,4-dienoyl-CoA reductase-like NADH-dependent reductase (Old Yellow Enzyme family)
MRGARSTPQVCRYDATTLGEQLSSLRIGYLHVGEAIDGPMAAPAGTIRVAPILRDKFSGTMIVNGSYDAHSGHAVIARGEADLVAFGVAFWPIRICPRATGRMHRSIRRTRRLFTPAKGRATSTICAGIARGDMFMRTVSICAKPAFCHRS